MSFTPFYIFFNKKPACILSPAYSASRSQACTQLSGLPYLLLRHSTRVVRVAPASLGPHLGAHPGQGAEGLVGLLVGGLAQLLKPGQPALFFQDGSGTGTHIAGTVPQAQLSELSLHFWPCGVGGKGSRGQASSNPSCPQASVSPPPHKNAFSKHPSLTLPPLRDPRTLACAKERVKAWVVTLYKCFLSTYYMLDIEAGTEKDLLPWRNCTIKFFNLSKGLFTLMT